MWPNVPVALGVRQKGQKQEVGGSQDGRSLTRSHLNDRTSATLPTHTPYSPLIGALLRWKFSPFHWGLVTQTVATRCPEPLGAPMHGSRLPWTGAAPRERRPLNPGLLHFSVKC